MKTSSVARYLAIILLVGASFYPLLYFSDQLLVSVGIRWYRHPSFIVHVDLKAAPPRIDYLLKLMSWLGSAGVSGVLLEYGSMFPFDRKVQELASRQGFSHEDVSDMMLTAERMGMEVIPFVQTFTDMDYVLQHPKLVKSFADAKPCVWSACHKHPLPESLVAEIVDQVSLPLTSSDKVMLPSRTFPVIDHNAPD